MATGADIPPELFRHILFDVCEDADELLDLSQPVPNRKETIKHVTACSLTCVYWARICREELFQYVSIKNYEDMCAFRSLVSNTPTRFAPISEYVGIATLVQRVGDRPWLHLLHMQPSLFPFWKSPDSGPVFDFHIEDSPNNATSLRSSTSRHLFASLPRTPPSLCLQCEDLTIDKPHFVTPHDLTSLLQKFSGYDNLRLTNVAWSAQADFASDLLARDLLLIPPFSNMHVEVYCSVHSAETAWVAFSTILRSRSTQASTVISASEYDWYDENENKRRPTLQVRSSAQRAIFDICKSVCKVLSFSYARFSTGLTVPGFKDILLKDPQPYLRVYHICSTTILEHEPASEEILSEIRFEFYGTQAVIPVTNVSDSIVIDSISMLCAACIHTQSTTEPVPSNFGHSSNKLPSTIASPWPEIVGLCAAQPGFIRLQLEFVSHDHLVQFMEAQHAALGKLDGRVALFYWNKEKTSHELRAADFETLADLGDAYEHGYIGLRL